MAIVLAAANAAQGGAKVFPPLDPATFVPQLVWLAIAFGLLYLLLSRVALPRVGEVIEERADRIRRDLDQAEKLKAETEGALAAYEQALTALEFLVAFLQAYVFTMLTCMYLNDALHPGH